MQVAYFDESGIDGAHGITLIAGVVARLEDWPRIVAAWRDQLATDGVATFHYYECKNQTGGYRGWDWFGDCVPHLERLAGIIALHPIGGVSAAFLGDWTTAVADRPDLQERFPSAYSFCFEMMVKKLRDEMHHHGQPDVVMVFARQREYQRRAIEVWHWHRARQAWPEIRDVRYAEPSDVPGLQMADMLAWETRRHLFKGGDEWRSLPLLRRLVAKQEDTGTALYEIGYRAENMAGIRRLEGEDAT